MTDDKKYVPDRGPVDMVRVRKFAMIGKFLKEYADLISPWACTVELRHQRAQSRLERGYAAAKIKAQNAASQE